jgi:hypothetical protein
LKKVCGADELLKELLKKGEWLHYIREEELEIRIAGYAQQLQANNKLILDEDFAENMAKGCSQGQ